MVAEGLRQADHDRVHVHDNGMQAALDVDVFTRAVIEDRVIVSADTVSGTPLALRQEAKPSVITLRLGSQCAWPNRSPSC
jgi:predicted nuclease of predicted toxin-antitoxin system